MSTQPCIRKTLTERDLAREWIRLHLIVSRSFSIRVVKYRPCFVLFVHSVHRNRSYEVDLSDHEYHNIPLIWFYEQFLPLARTSFLIYIQNTSLAYFFPSLEIHIVRSISDDPSHFVRLIFLVFFCCCCCCNMSLVLFSLKRSKLRSLMVQKLDKKLKLFSTWNVLPCHVLQSEFR